MASEWVLERVIANNPGMHFLGMTESLQEGERERERDGSDVAIGVKNLHLQISLIHM